MKKSVKRIVSFVSAIAMLSTTAMAVSAADTVTVQQTNAVKVSTAEDCAKTTNDVIVITAATDKIESAALDILKATFNAKAATKEAIAEAVKSMSADDISAAVDKAVKDEKNLEAMDKAITEAADKVEELVNATRNNGKVSSIVVSDVYNPLAGVAGGKVVQAAKEAIQEKIDAAQKQIDAAVAKSDTTGRVVMAPVEAAKVDINAIKVGGKAAAESVTKTFEAQEASKVEAVNAAEVKGEKVDFTYGDINNDGNVKAVDLVIALQYQLEILDDKECDNLGYKIGAADVNKDGKVDVADLALMKLVLLGDKAATDLGKMAL